MNRVLVLHYHEIWLKGGNKRYFLSRLIAAVKRALADLPVCKDIVVTTPEEITRRGDLIGTVLRPALREGKVLYERS